MTGQASTWKLIKLEFGMVAPTMQSSCALYVLAMLYIICLSAEFAYALHNPLMRKTCLLGQELYCYAQFIICWDYRCKCIENHVYLGPGLGCLFDEFA
ncbi:uncharacterized protein LOC121404405 [Drosophila obscura]|uniref:uncharacterized protein LOC121404405 n=1 Tax=Drosophila obscura TaxID=7282 RepID=UPI001BB17B6A|nr:uncharacterized protein LOC121404405 [Drosophila obscura]